MECSDEMKKYFDSLTDEVKIAYDLEINEETVKVEIVQMETKVFKRME